MKESCRCMIRAKLNVLAQRTHDMKEPRQHTDDSLICVMAHVWVSHGAWWWVVAHVCMSHGTYIWIESRDTYEWHQRSHVSAGSHMCHDPLHMCHAHMAHARITHGTKLWHIFEHMCKWRMCVICTCTLVIIGLFCRISSLLWGSFAKETYNFKEPTNGRVAFFEQVYMCKWRIRVL